MSKTTVRYYFNLKTNSISAVNTCFKKSGPGTCEAKEGWPQHLGQVKGCEISLEVKNNDNVFAKMQMLQSAVRTGKKIVADSSREEEICNGRMNTEWLSEDGQLGGRKFSSLNVIEDMCDIIYKMHPIIQTKIEQI